MSNSILRDKWVMFWLVMCAITIPVFHWQQESKRIPLEPFDQQLESIDGMTYEGPRSSEWVQVRSDFVRKHPRCEACGSAYNLNVHHIKPFHLYPELELVESNFITLCRDCHYHVGHDPDGKGPAKPNWSASNPNVRQDAKNWSKR